MASQPFIFSEMMTDPSKPISLYVDEDAMSRDLIRGLRSRGVNVTTVSEEMMTGRTDEEQL